MIFLTPLFFILQQHWLQPEDATLNSLFEQSFRKVPDLEPEIRRGVVEYYFEHGKIHTRFKSSSFRNLRNFPEEFDARKAWPGCHSITQTYDTGQCVAPLAHVFVSTLNDRLCIVRGNNSEFEHSMEDFLSCCKDCGQNQNQSICSESNEIFKAFKFWLAEGLVSGGGHNSKKGCKPYSDEMYKPFYDANERLTFFVSTCKRKCTNEDYEKSYDQDKLPGENMKVLIRNEIGEIKAEIMEGPVLAVFILFEDFFLHGQGIYEHKMGALLGVVTIKIIGWGESQGTFYWWIYLPQVSHRPHKTGFFQIASNKRLEKLIFVPVLHNLDEVLTTTQETNLASSTSASIVVLMAVLKGLFP